jgi:hypothetical protein
MRTRGAFGMNALVRWLATPGAVIAAVVLTMAIRAIAAIAMPAPLESDSLAYFTMAKSFAEGGAMIDHFGQYAFYSPGYPMLLVPFFMIFAASAGVALAVNVALCGIACWLLIRIGTRLAGPVAGVIAGLAFAVWLPGILGATFVHKESLTTVLVLTFVHLILGLKDQARPEGQAVMAGATYGFGLLAGASSILIAAGALWAIFRLARHERAALLAFAGGALLCLVPWLTYTNSLFGKPVLTTNSGFNLYLGNNPAATGRFVSIADTPVGPHWQALLKGYGEDKASEALGAKAREWIAKNPGQAAGLATTKLGLFWAPNIPDRQELTASPAIGAIRLVDVAQHLIIMALGLWGLWLMRQREDARTVAIVMVAFWGVHALTYIITRYRDPVMPLMIAFAAIPVANWIAARRHVA